MKPLDHPFPERPHRRYVALTNHCNRACPWCSTCSSPAGGTFLSIANFVAALPAEGLFQVQLEGGEPTVHPEFWGFVEAARAHPRCAHLVVCTNGVRLPRTRARLAAWVARLGAPLTIKLSFNHHLLDADPGLIQLALDLRGLLPDQLFVLNVRLRPGDERIRDAVEVAGLLPVANVFTLQRYGFADGEESWEPPAPVWSAFSMQNPDGRVYGPDLIARSEGMRGLP